LQVGASAVSAERQYDAFRNILASTGTWTSPFGYAGSFGYQEDATGYKLLGHRLYDPETGRFLTRDPAKDGRNWYGYCGNNPVSGADPSGKVRIKVVEYNVFWIGWHRGLIVEDNMGTGGPTWSFAGGPQDYGIGLDNGDLVSKSGPWREGTQDFDEIKKRKGQPGEVRVLMLVDDDSSYATWISRLKTIENMMSQHKPKRYWALADDYGFWDWRPGPSANSNSWCRYSIKAVGLSDQFDHAVNKASDAPWAPGWKNEPFFEEYKDRL
jgi:RHS repeat-associated protein